MTKRGRGMIHSLQMTPGVPTFELHQMLGLTPGPIYCAPRTTFYVYWARGVWRFTKRGVFPSHGAAPDAWAPGH